jgi:hypothetical protein
VQFLEVAVFLSGALAAGAQFGPQLRAMEPGCEQYRERELDKVEQRSRLSLKFASRQGGH